MRLIDADALRKELRKKNLPISGADVYFVRKLIDNAPTVDTYTEDDVQYAIKEGHQVSYEMAKAKFERPQGEWLTHRVAFHLTCPFCGCNIRALKDKVFEGDYEYNFCPNCGADMRGKDNE